MKQEAIQYTQYTEYPCHLSRLEWIYDTIDQGRKPSSKVQVLDVGAGTGNVTIPLGTIENSDILGIDIHQPTLDIAIEANKLPNVHFKFEYLQDSPLAGKEYIILTEVLEHIGPYPEILDYLGKNSDKNMKLLITVPNGFGPFEIAMQPLYFMRKIGLNNFILKVKRILGKKEPYSQNYETPHVNFFTVGRMRRELKQYGLKITEVKKAYVFAPIIETYLPFIPLKGIARLDNKLASILPAFMASGFYFKIEHE
ncbi:MAG TPA: class I SAM-dependent methyltransferase [Flavobacteriales bacterium]|nr:class I SAM-dependent methyltransferase [Flavobacteriales bacterium]HPH81857.1 class I SAM-dependent methyltransferase [Flavobacteriales bacterium]